MKNNLTDSIYKAWRTGILPLEAVCDSLKDVISAHYSKLIPKNIEALEAGAAAAKEAGF